MHSVACEKCRRPFRPADARWFYTPGPGGITLAKCQMCGSWSDNEKRIVLSKLALAQRNQQLRALPSVHLSRLGGCNCNGRRKL